MIAYRCPDCGAENFEVWDFQDSLSGDLKLENGVLTLILKDVDFRCTNCKTGRLYKRNAEIRIKDTECYIDSLQDDSANLTYTD